MKKIKKIITASIAALTILSTASVTANAAWKQNSTGWWYTEGNTWATGWRLINGNWYLFDSNGYMKTGWQYNNGNWYYLYSSGAMAHSTTIDGYYLNASGAWTNNATSSNSKAIKEGTYKVGKDIQAGEYLIKSTTGAYYECNSDSTGDYKSIIFNGNISKGGHEYITLKEGECITLKRGEMYTVVDAPSVIPTNGLYANGMYKVGKDIPAGEYLVTSTDDTLSGYIAVSTDSRHNVKSIVTNDNFKGTTYITVEDGQYLKLSRAQIQK